MARGGAGASIALALGDNVLVAKTRREMHARKIYRATVIHQAAQRQAVQVQAQSPWPAMQM